MKPHPVVSFFSGCGGLDLGFTGGFAFKNQNIPKLPFQILAAYDNNEQCVKTYRDNISEHVTLMDLACYEPSGVPHADVLIGGFPCQDFATCGPRKGLTSKRGRLYQSLIKYMKYHQPKIVVGENVPGLANMRKGEVLRIIRDDLQNCGYKVEIWTLFAPDFGVPQRRNRLFIIAVRSDLDGFPNQPRSLFNDKKYNTTEWAICDLESVADESVPNQSQYFKASKAKRGNGQGDEVTPADAPSYTIRANAKSRVQFHYKLDRRLTVRECARLQTFPDNFVFPHSTTTNIMEIGNAVPPLLGYYVAKSIADFLDDHK